jgi:hypothetical protein
LAAVSFGLTIPKICKSLPLQILGIVNPTETIAQITIPNDLDRQYLRKASHLKKAVQNPSSPNEIQAAICILALPNLI